MSKISSADNFAAAAQMLQSSHRSGLSEKILGRQLFEVNADGSIRKQTASEQIKSFGLRLVRQFDAHAQSKDALVGQALRNLYARVSPGSAYARTGADLNGQLGRFMLAQPELSDRRPSVPTQPPNTLSPFASAVAGVSLAEAQRPAAASPPIAAVISSETQGSENQLVLADDEDLSDLLMELPPEIRQRIATNASEMTLDTEEDLSDLLQGLPADVAERLKLPEVKPGTVRQNSDGSFPESAIGSNGRRYQLSVTSQSAPEARSALAWINSQFKGRDGVMVGRALADAGIIEDFTISGRSKRTTLERPATLSEISDADRQAFALALQSRQAQANERTIPAATYGAQTYQALESAQDDSPVREAVANSRLRDHPEATQRAYFLFDQELESTLSGMAGRDQKFPGLPPTRLSPDSLDGLVESAIRQAAKEYGV